MTAFFETNVAEVIDSSGLTWTGASVEELLFMKKVYDYNLSKKDQQKFRAFVRDAELEVIEGNRKARTAAAQACKNLLADIRTAITNQQVNSRIGIASAYRSAARQFELWNSYFPGYFRDTADDRNELHGGSLGDEAVKTLARYINKRIAVPGYSNHGNGLAIDFENYEGNEKLANSSKKSLTALWRQSWIWNWLITNAANYNFYQNTAIDEPWHWEYRLAGETTEYYTSENELSDNAETAGTFKKFKSPDEVRYLTFEGGGGKGLLFPAVIAALEKLLILQGPHSPQGPVRGILGVSGSSAGAMTALMVALGYNSDEMMVKMNSRSFNEFFDLPAGYPNLPLLPSSNYPNIVGKIKPPYTSSPRYWADAIRTFADNFPGGIIKDKVIDYVISKIYAVDNSNKNYPATAKLKDNVMLYLENFNNYFGMFSGGNITLFFSELINEKMGVTDLTFEQLYQKTKIKLVITGTHLERSKTEFFSIDTFPKMSIITATRISMSIPFVFAPVVITRTQAAYVGHQELEGTWVDGGLYNNMPITAFENEINVVKGLTKPYTLGLRLGDDGYKKIDGLLPFISAVVNPMNAGKSAISSSSGFKEQTISLNTEGLSTLNFDPDKKVLREKMVEAIQKVLEYFKP